MSRVEACERQRELHQGKYITEICIELRMSLNGSSDPWSDELTQDTIKMLEDRIASWHPTDSPFDHIVYALVVVTVIDDDTLDDLVLQRQRARAEYVIVSTMNAELLRYLEDKRTEEATLKRQLDQLEIHITRRFLEVVA